MALIVQKFGGTSVGSIERIKNVAARALATQAAGNDVVVIVSAMSGETNRLLKLASDLTGMADGREVDALAATGEQVTAALTAIAIQAAGGKARSFLGHQLKVLTDSAFTKARIKAIDAGRLTETLASGTIAVVAGFQGVDEEGSITTLGRGGSDTSAVAVAAAIGASACEIFTDVDGVYTTDPNICKTARKIERISYEEMLELASLGAKVLQIRSVEVAMKYGVPVHVRSSFSDAPGTWVVGEDALESVTVTGVAYDKAEARVMLVGVDDAPGMVANIFGALAAENVGVDMIIQNASSSASKTDVTFTVNKTDLGQDQARHGAHRRRRTRLRRALRRGRRQGLHRGPRHALPRRRGRADVPHPRRRAHQHPGDLHQRDQGLLPGGHALHRAGGARAARRVRSGVVRQDPTP